MCWLLAGVEAAASKAAAVAVAVLPKNHFRFI
jgi:hypothetical protein